MKNIFLLKKSAFIIAITLVSSMSLANPNEQASLNESPISGNCFTADSFSNEDKLAFEKTTKFINLLSEKEQQQVLITIDTKMKKAKSCPELIDITKEIYSSLSKTWDQFTAFTNSHNTK